MSDSAAGHGAAQNPRSAPGGRGRALIIAGGVVVALIYAWFIWRAVS